MTAPVVLCWFTADNTAFSARNGADQFHYAAAAQALWEKGSQCGGDYSLLPSEADPKDYGLEGEGLLLVVEFADDWPVVATNGDPTTYHYWAAASWLDERARHAFRQSFFAADQEAAKSKAIRDGITDGRPPLRVL